MPSGANEGGNEWEDLHFMALWRSFNRLKRYSLLANSWTHCRLDKGLLYLALGSCHRDLEHFARGRDIQPDLHKEAAFLVTWLVRLRPIQVNPTWDVGLLSECDWERRQGDPFHPLMANEYLALYHAMTLLGIIFPGRPGAPNFLHDYPQNLLYLFHFHGVKSKRQLASEFYLLQTLHGRRDDSATERSA